MSAAWAIALRDLRGGRSGLALLFACLALSVASIASVGSLADSIRSAIGASGRQLLGADLLLSVSQREADARELAAMRALGPVSRSVTTRTNAVVPDGRNAFVELSGIDPSWPPAGQVDMAGGRMPRGPGEAAIGVELGERLALRTGDRLRLGYAQFTVSGLVRAMPAASGFAFAPPVLVSHEGLARTRLVRPGSLSTTGYRILLGPQADPEAIGAAFEERFASRGWRVTDRSDAAGGTRRFVGRVEQLLMLIALAALAVGGLGIASAVRAFAVGRQRTIAVLKMVGAPRRTVALVLVAQVALVAGLAIVLGLGAGAMTPRVASAAVRDWLPVALDPGPQWRALGTALAYGILVTFAASWGSLTAAVQTRAARVFRQAASGVARPGLRARAVPALALLAAIALAVANARDPLFVLTILAGLAMTAGLFALLGMAIRRLGRFGAAGRGPILRLGIAALDRPGAATVRLSVAMGLGLALLTLLQGVGSSLLTQLDDDIAERAPALLMADIPKSGAERVRVLARQAEPNASVTMVPTLRGQVSAVDGVPVAQLGEVPEGGWILRGDRGLTFTGPLPPGNRIVAGQWWPRDYSGPPLVSLEADAARALDLQTGDTLTVTVLGRPIEARIASLREIDWRSLGFNFGIVFAPGTLDSAPFTYLATLDLPPGSDALPAFERSMSAALPEVTMVRVGDIVQRVRDTLVALEAAVRIATAVAIAIAAVVLAGSVIATRRERQRESVLLKLLGATRAQVLAVQGAEFAALCGLVALAAIGAGTLGAWGIVAGLFDLPFQPDWASLLLLPALATLFLVAAAAAAAIPALLARPARALRAA